MANATTISKEILRRNNEQWSSVPRTAELLQRKKDIRTTPKIIENVHRIWAKNQIMPLLIMTQFWTILDNLDHGNSEFIFYYG